MLNEIKFNYIDLENFTMLIASQLFEYGSMFQSIM